jgi:hypothetical protein
MNSRANERACARNVLLAGILAFTTGILGAEPRARADDETVSLTWNAPAQCPSAQEIHASIRRLLASKAPAPSDRPVTAKVTLFPSGTVWRAEIVTESDGLHGRRKFEGDTCATVADAAALVLAIMVNPEKVAHRDLGPSPPSSEARDNAPESPAPQPRPPARHVEDEHAFVIVRAFGLSDFSTVPAPTFGTGIGIELGIHRLRVGAIAVAQPYQDVMFDDSTGLGARLRVTRVGTRACIAILRGAVEVAPCAGGEVVWMAGHALGVNKPENSVTQWAELVAGPEARISIGSGLGLVLDADAQVPIRRRDFAIRPPGIVHTVPALTTRATFGFDVRF